jgi:hypothetical protein
MKLSIQFHSTLEESIEFVNSVSDDLSLFVAIVNMLPIFKIKAVAELSIADFEENDVDTWIVFSQSNSILSCESVNQFNELNSTLISLRIGSQKRYELKESFLSFMSDDREAYQVAKKIAGHLKNRTKPGVVAFNPLNGAEVKLNTHRYSKGAKAMYLQGIKLLPLAGNSLLKIPD